MTAITYNNQNNGGKLFLVFILLAVFSFIIFFSVNSHAFERHGEDAVNADFCYQKNGSIKVFKNPDTLRCAHILLEGGVYGIRIEEESGDLVTTFFKKQAKRISQVIQYLENTGYTEVIK